MTYEEALHFLESIYGLGAKLGLENIRRLLDRLDNPQEKVKVIHIAGTNGKGSATAMLGSVLRQAGFTVGAYTSPHLVRYNERFTIGGEPISDADFAAYAGRVADACGEMAAAGFGHPTVFEVLTAMGFLYFAEKRVDYLLLEVGLGGRFDATNVVKAPVLSVIMSIGMDHMEYLGSRLDGIAMEKGGIIKENCPVVLYQQGPVVYNVISEICRNRGAKLYFAPDTVISTEKQSLGETVFSVKNRYLSYEHVTLHLLGEYQKQNCAAVLLACRALQDCGLPLTEADIRRGLEEARWPGRMEIAGRDPLLLLDGAHNVDGISMLAASLKSYFPNREITLVLGVLGDKEYEKMTALLLPLVRRVVLTEPENTRKLDVDALRHVVEPSGIPVIQEKNIGQAVKRARALAGRDGVVCCAGSLYLIGAIRGLLEKGEI